MYWLVLLNQSTDITKSNTHTHMHMQTYHISTESTVLDKSIPTITEVEIKVSEVNIQ